MKYINVVLKMVKKTETKHEKVLKLIGCIKARIRVRNDQANSGTYMNRYPEGKQIENVWKKDNSWYWVVG